MTPQQLKALDRRSSSFLEDLLAPMGRSERRHWARTYVEGLLLDGERKSIEPMASRLSGVDVQALRQFVGQSPWTVEEIQRQLALKVVDLISSPEVWILDDTSFPKAGLHSVGVGRQYCGALGKVANCQVAVTLHWSSAEASCPLPWRLFVLSSDSKIPSEPLKSNCLPTSPSAANQLTCSFLVGRADHAAGDRFLSRTPTTFDSSCSNAS